MTCNNPVEVFLRAAGVFFGKNDIPVMFRTCNSPVEVFLCGAGASLLQKVTRKWHGYVCDGRGLIKAHSLKEVAFINGSGFG